MGLDMVVEVYIDGWLTGLQCIFGCRNELLKGFTNVKHETLFPGTRAVCKSY